MSPTITDADFEAVRLQLKGLKKILKGLERTLAPREVTSTTAVSTMQTYPLL